MSKKWSNLFFIVLCVLALCFLYCFQFILASGSSMEPTFLSGDMLLRIRPFREPQVGDVVVIRHKNKLMVKRVAAVAGQTAISPDIGETPDAASIHRDDLDPVDLERVIALWGDYEYWQLHGYWSDSESATVPEGCIFVVGDNLPKSYDCRYEDFGLISTEQIQGFILFRLWPLGSRNP